MSEISEESDAVKNVVITGGAGFIGCNLARTLTDYTVTIFDNLSSGNTDIPPANCQLFEGDVKDLMALKKCLESANADTVVHLAAAGSVVESVEYPMRNFESNALGTVCVLEACRTAKVERVVFASTGGALIGDAPPPVSELSLPKPISPYGASKLTGEAYCHAYAQAYGLKTIALRFANIYGPCSAHKKGAITTFIKALLAGRPIPIFGDGLSTRDYLYVSDLCGAIASALTADIAGGEVIHVASGIETSVIDLAKSLCKISGFPDHEIQLNPKRAGEVERNFARYDKAQKLLGFEPRTSLQSGLQMTWDWFAAKDQAVQPHTGR